MIKTQDVSAEKQGMANIDAIGHVTGKSIYVDDIPVRSGTLYISVFDSPIAHGIIRQLDYKEATQMPGVVKVITYRDIPGENQVGGIVNDEPLLAEHEVHYMGQPILLVVAESEEEASAARATIKFDIEERPVITDPREAYEQGQTLHPSRTFRLGSLATAFRDAVHVFEGATSSGGQEHLYLETQGAYAYPMENGSIKIHSSTQGPTQVQRTISRVLGIGMHKIEVDVARIGGGFGGKEDQASPFAAMTALAVWLLQKPVKCILHRMEDMRMTGKRHPYKGEYKIGLDKDLRIIAYQATFYQNGGASADLSPAVLERTLFHATNSYFIPNVRVTAHCCKTNLPPNTAFRGFGGPQGMFVIEAAIDHAARELKVAASEIQSKNLLQNGSEFPYGQIVEDSLAKACWTQLANTYPLAQTRTEIDIFNRENTLHKKGMALMPICFGISFTNTRMNHSRALVHVYADGSVGISTGAIEMGQGVNTKMLQVAAHEFGLDPALIKIETTNTTRVANTSPSAASATADLNGKALLDACRQIKSRLEKIILSEFDLPPQTQLTFREGEIHNQNINFAIPWTKAIGVALEHRVNLSAKGHYATPKIHFDKSQEKGHPFAYHVFGASLFKTTVDCIRGTYTIDEVSMVHDAGSSMNHLIDLGQIEGGLVQGIGWMTMEEVIYNEHGRLLSNALSTYKIPDIYSVPETINTHFLVNPDDNLAIYKSKAVGEPPLMYGIGAYFALRDAMLAFNPSAKIEYDAPMTAEKVLMGLYAT